MLYHTYLCQRCNTKADATLPNGYLYCRECIGVGRISEEKNLERNIEKSTYPKIVTPLSWHKPFIIAGTFVVLLFMLWLF